MAILLNLVTNLTDKPETPYSDEMTSLSSRASSFHCRRSLFGFLYSDACQPCAPADIRSVVSHIRVSSADESSIGRAH